MSETPTRARRSDATENRDRLLAAARDVFARRGFDAPLEEIARTANVSRTTLYRNFPTREDLMTLLLEDNVLHIEERASVIGDVPDGLRELIDYVLALQRDNRSLAVVLSGADLAWLSELNARTVRAIEPLLASAHRRGEVHDEVDIEDVMLAFPMAQGAMSDDQGRIHTSEQIRAMLHRAIFRPR